MGFNSCILCFVGTLFALASISEAVPAVFLPTSCGTANTLTSSVQLVGATGLTYANNLDCNITFTVPTSRLVLATVQRFQLEPQISGVCQDYVNLHDGSDVSSSTINSDALCGSSVTNTTYVTTGQSMTLHFITDSTAVYLGFNIIFTAISVAPCGADQFTCNNSYCTPSDLVCDTYDQCGDTSDESDCQNYSTEESTDWTPLIVGLTLGLLAAVLVASFLAYRVHRRNRWKRFTHDHIDQEDIPDPDPRYPVTNKYFRGIRGHPDIKSPSYEATEAREATAEESEKPLKT